MGLHGTRSLKDSCLLTGHQLTRKLKASYQSVAFPERDPPARIIDCFLFNNELDMLEFRLKVSWIHPKHVAVPCTRYKLTCILNILVDLGPSGRYLCHK